VQTASLESCGLDASPTPITHCAIRSWPACNVADKEDGTPISNMLYVIDGFCREIEIYKVAGNPIERIPDT
jgi:hypothetical protein